MSVKTELLSFEDTETAFASKSDKELKKTYRLFSLFNQPALLPIGTSLTQLAFKLNLPVKSLVKNTIFKQFCGGETLQECQQTISRLAKYHVKTMLEYSVETKANETEYDRTLNEVLSDIELAGQNDNVKIVSCKITGFARFGLLEKIHAGENLDSAEIQEFEIIKNRMEQICLAADKSGVWILFDAEESWIQQPIDNMVDTLMQKYNRGKVVVFNTYQLYLKGKLGFLKSSLDKAKKEGYLLGAKLVRGAYVEKEANRAAQNNTSSAVHASKKEVDEDYNNAVQFCLDNIEGIAFGVATHNEESCRLTVRQMETKGLKNHPHIFFCQLYGMGEHITYKLAKEGFEVAKLIPHGPVAEAVPYLMRRAKENSSVTGHTVKELVLLAKEMKRRKLI